MTRIGRDGDRPLAMWYADTVGLRKVYERVLEFEAQHGYWWRPAPLLKELAEKGSTFAQWGRR